jgi:alkylhydroperoxidase/carboxymuconolactone decarboxylase family protein YurZ
MDRPELEAVVKNLDRRVTGIEQILPTLATKEDLRAAVAPLATREEMRSAIDTAIAKAVAPLATLDEMHNAINTAIAKAVAPLATREEMHNAINTAIAKAVAPLATREEMFQAVREEGQQTRRHFDVVAESLRGDIRLVAEGHAGLQQRVDTEVKAADATLDRRATRLEAERRKP